MKPQFSVIVPAYNSAGTIERCLSSILEQTYTNFELIVVDDASTDHTTAVVASISDPRLRLIRGATNRGPSACRNQALDEARGRLVVFADADDWLEPAFFASAVAAAEGALAPDFLVTRYQVVSRCGRTPDRQRFAGGDALAAFLEDRIVSSVWAKVYERAIIAQHGVRFPDLRLSEDSVFNARYLAHVRSALLVEGPPLYNYDARGESTTSVIALEPLIDAANHALSLTAEALGPLRSRYAGALRVREFRMIAVHAIRHLARHIDSGRYDDRTLREVRARLWRRFGWRVLAAPGLRRPEKLAYAAFMLAPRQSVRALARRERTAARD